MHVPHPFRAGREATAGIALLAATLLWSGNFVAGRAVRDAIDPLTLNWLRWAVALAAMLPFVGAAAWRRRAALVREWRLLALLGATGVAAFQTITNLAVHSTTALNALLVLSLTPALILACVAALGQARPSPRQWAGTVLSALGVAVVVARGSLHSLLSIQPAPGDLWMLLAVLLWTAYSLLLRRRPADLPASVVLAGSVVLALAMMLPVAACTGALRPPPMTPLIAWVVLYLAAASVGGFLFWAHGVTVLGAERAAPYLQLMPLFGAVIGLAVLGDAISSVQVAGGALVLAGIALVQAHPSSAAVTAPRVVSGARPAVAPAR